ncbi:hypothetical protein FPV67DRAFT_437484 [Lyophyllum atratum]|nr:hypothetical protein FPV67DRAFT_437484 [Lyophyllum atratum]
MARILPIRSASRTPFIFLPFPIIRRIALYACNLEEKRWRQALLSYGLVCKSWAPVLDLFFEVFLDPNYDSRKNECPPSIGAVARSLSNNPTRGALIKTYSPLQYRLLLEMRATVAAFEEFCEAQNTILCLATSLMHVTVASTLVSLFQEFVDILCTLEDVQSFRVMNLTFWELHLATENLVRSLSFEDIRRIIAHWPRLTRLKLVRWASSPSSSSQSVSSEPSRDLGIVVQNTEYEGLEPLYQIEDLSLFSGELTAPQLRILVSPSQHLAPTLRKAAFENVRGISNADFLAFLTSVASTLVSLNVVQCNIPRASEDEEYAIDAAMPNLVSLESFEVDGDHASALSISRKIRRNIPRKTRKLWSFRGDMMMINNPNSMDLESIIEALSLSGWDSVTVVQDPEKRYSLHMLSQASDIAQERGIYFNCISNPVIRPPRH